MNLARPPLEAVSHVFRSWLTLRRLLPKRKCQTFGVQHVGKDPRIEKVYVINLDREPGRWSKKRWTPSFGQVFVTAKVESRFMIQATLG